MAEKETSALIQCRPIDMLDNSVLQWLSQMKFEFHLSTLNGLVLITALPEGWSRKDTGESTWKNSPWHIWDIYDASGKKVADFDSDEGYFSIIPDNAQLNPLSP